MMEIVFDAFVTMQVVFPHVVTVAANHQSDKKTITPSGFVMASISLSNMLTNC